MRGPPARSKAERARGWPAPATPAAHPHNTTAPHSAGAPMGGHDAPAAADAPAGHVFAVTSTALPPALLRIVGGACKLFEVRTMREHQELMSALLARDVLWTAPIITLDNREDMRVAVYLAKSIAHLTLEPQLVQVLPAGHERALVEVQGVVTLAPKRSAWVPPSLLLPEALHIRATIRLGVRGPLDSGKIELIDGRWHNLPSLPGCLCRAVGLGMGTLPRLAEPAWARALPLVGDDSCASAML